MHDQAIWKTAPPLWRDALAGTVELDRPALLRFDSDDFIERLQTNLDDPRTRNVGAFVLRDETWKTPRAGLAVAAGSALPKLYQPIHGRHYLVAGALVCERYGLPDKVVHPNCGESAFYVLRRLQPVNGTVVDPTERSTYHEFGWVPSGPAGRWVAVTHGLVHGEEHLPLFPMTYVDGHRRRVLAGTIPVGAREKYAGALPPNPITTTGDPAAVLALPGRDRLETVVMSLEALLRTAKDRPAGAGPSADAQRVTFDARFTEATYFALVDFAGFLVAELPGVWDNSVASGGGRQLADLLRERVFRTGQSWMSALISAHGTSAVLLNEPSNPPGPVAGVSVAAVVEAIRMLGTPPPTADAAPRQLFTKVNTALVQRDNAAAAAVAAAASSDAGQATQTPPQPNRNLKAVYVTRLVYERPRCAEAHRVVVSAPSEPFQLAHFYDPDAPFREHKIVLPVDTSLAGLRKFPKAVRMELSSQLRKQVERIQAIKVSDLEDGNIPAEGSGSLGMICSLSIPIITICALILLMIIVSLLNIIFFWVPLFKICLPKVDE